MDGQRAGRYVRVLLSLDDDELPGAGAALRATFARLRMQVVEDVEAADLFVGVYGDRYGAIDPRFGVSRLERDYLAAGSRPRLVYVTPGAGARDQHLSLLLSRIQADDLTSYRRVSGPEELVTLAADDVTMVLTEAFTGGEAVAANGAAAAPERGDDAGRPPVRARIPAPWHRLIGRDRELEDLRRLLGSGPTRLVTLTGLGGIGKSRLAIEVATACEDSYRDGAWFVDLAAARDPALVAPTIAHALGVREAAGALPLESLKSYLAPRTMLLMLDSFEPVLAAAPLVVDLLGAAPNLRVLVTSRSVLRVRGEQEYPVAPLDVPDTVQGVAAAGPALELFLERAAAANPSRVLSESERVAAAEICRRLDGVPLALELAAARTRVLSPSALLGRLSQALDVLGSGPVDLPERQRALRTTLDWDYQLLGDEEKVVFRRLTVFPRLFTLAAADAVLSALPAEQDRASGGLGLDIVDGLDGLVGKSLVRPTEIHPETGEPSFVMVQTVRDYGLERLSEAGEAEEVGRRHAYYVLARVEETGTRETSQQERWLAVLEHEHSDIRAALDWADRTRDVELLMRLAAALGWFWRAHCHFSEARRWLDRTLALSAGHRTATRADLLDGAAYLSRARGDYDVAETQYRDAMAIRVELGDDAGLVSSQRFIGNIAYDRGDLDSAEEWWRRSLATLDRVDDDARRMGALNNLGVLAHSRGDEQEALRLYDEAHTLATRLGYRDHIARTRMNKALALAALGEYGVAREFAAAAVEMYAELDDTWDLVDALDVLAGAIGRQQPGGDVAFAGWLYGGAASLRTALDVRRPQTELAEYEGVFTVVRAMDPDGFDRSYAEGEGSSLEHIVACALGWESR